MYNSVARLLHFLKQIIFFWGRKRPNKRYKALIVVYKVAMVVLLLSLYPLMRKVGNRIPA